MQKVQAFPWNFHSNQITKNPQSKNPNQSKVEQIEANKWRKRQKFDSNTLTCPHEFMRIALQKDNLYVLIWLKKRNPFVIWLNSYGWIERKRGISSLVGEFLQMGLLLFLLLLTEQWSWIINFAPHHKKVRAEVFGYGSLLSFSLKWEYNNWNKIILIDRKTSGWAFIERPT